MVIYVEEVKNENPIKIDSLKTQLTHDRETTEGNLDNSKAKEMEVLKKGIFQKIKSCW